MAARPSRLVIEFGHTTSAHRDAAVALARQFRRHEKQGEGRTMRHVCPVALRSERELKAALELLRLVSNWKSASVLVDGTPASPWQIERVVTCALQKCRKGPEQRAHHCDGGGRPDDDAAPVRIPCRQFAAYDRSAVEWWRFGKMAQGVFHVDRKAAHEELRARTDELGCGWCPGLELRRMKKAVARLPGRIDPMAEGSEWSPRKAGSRVVGVQPRTRTNPATSLSFTIGLSGADRDHEDPGSPPISPDGPTYADIGGLDEPLRQVRELLELPLRRPEVFQHLGIEAPRGVLLTGPPGCGKTLIARAVAREVGASFHAVTVTELLSKYIGESERHIRQLFEQAAANAPAIVFLDEIDAIGFDRSTARHGWEVGPLTQLLGILDGFRALEGVQVLAATNRPERLDPALVRPGRFDRIIEIPPPSMDGRLAILRVHTAKMPLAGDVDLHALASASEGFTGADLRALCQEAGMAALRRADGVHGDDNAERWGHAALEKLAVTERDFSAALAAVRRRHDHPDPKPW